MKIMYWVETWQNELRKVCVKETEKLLISKTRDLPGCAKQLPRDDVDASPLAETPSGAWRKALDRHEDTERCMAVAMREQRLKTNACRDAARRAGVEL